MLCAGKNKVQQLQASLQLLNFRWAAVPGNTLIMFQS